jgi:hypothetical protein
MIPSQNSLKKEEMLLEKILERDNLIQRFLVQDLTTFKTQYLSMVVNNNLNMDLAQEYK